MKGPDHWIDQVPIERLDSEVSFIAAIIDTNLIFKNIVQVNIFVSKNPSIFD